MAALQTSTSIFPYLARVWDTSDSQSSRLPIWHAMAVASLPSLRIAAATGSLASTLRLETTTFAPARARASAIARPMPRDEPVTIAVLSVRSNNVPPLGLRGAWFVVRAGWRDGPRTTDHAQLSQQPLRPRLPE